MRTTGRISRGQAPQQRLRVTWSSSCSAVAADDQMAPLLTGKSGQRSRRQTGAVGPELRRNSTAVLKLCQGRNTIQCCQEIHTHLCCICMSRQYAALLHQAHLLFLLGRGLLFDRAADDPLLQVGFCITFCTSCHHSQASRSQRTLRKL